MKIKYLVDEDIANYKQTSMFIGFPHCSFKCDHECGSPVCQNSKLAQDPTIEITVNEIVSRYINNPLTSAIVIGGLEPFDDWNDLLELMRTFRQYTNDEIIIYTGYYPDEIQQYIPYIKNIQNVLIKYGRFIPNQFTRYDELLGVNLASDNQFTLYYVGDRIYDSREVNDENNC